MIPEVNLRFLNARNVVRHVFADIMKLKIISCITYAITSFALFVVSRFWKKRKKTMTDKLKEIIENAPVKTRGAFRCLFFLSNGEYDGFWGKNGYDNILIFGYDDEQEKWCKVAAYADKFDIFKIEGTFNLHIHNDLGVPVIWFNKPVYIDNTLMLSNVVGRIGQWEYENDDNGNDISGEDLDEQYQRGRATREFIEDLTRGEEKEE